MMYKTCVSRSSVNTILFDFFDITVDLFKK